MNQFESDRCPWDLYTRIPRKLFSKWTTTPRVRGRGSAKAREHGEPSNNSGIYGPYDRVWVPDKESTSEYTDEDSDDGAEEGGQAAGSSLSTIKHIVLFCRLLNEEIWLPPFYQSFWGNSCNCMHQSQTCAIRYQVLIMV